MRWINDPPMPVAKIDAFPFYWPMETAMAEVPVEVKKAQPAQTTLPDV